MSHPAESTTAMRWSAAHSRHAVAAQAAEEVAGRMTEELGEGPIDVVLFFPSAPFTGQVAELAAALKRRLSPGCLLGASAAGVIASHEEIEEGPALSAVAARLPGVSVAPFVVSASDWNQGMEDAAQFAQHAPGASNAELVLLLGDPFSLHAEQVLETFHRHVPGLRIVGGMSSAGRSAGTNALVLNDWVASDGGVAVALGGALRADTVVSQGCLPIGPALEVTRVDRNLLIELDGQPAVTRAQQVLRGLPGRERQLARQGLLVGRPVRRDAAGRGDYLIRNLIGQDRHRGALAVGDVLKEGERIRLHVRDAATAREDLELLLSPQVFDSPTHAALVFSCNSRGRNLYPQPDGDITIVQRSLGGSIPAAGMFCAGEIGPVGSRNFLHGHTASIAIVRPK